MKGNVETGLLKWNDCNLIFLVSNVTLMKFAQEGYNFIALFCKNKNFNENKNKFNRSSLKMVMN